MTDDDHMRCPDKQAQEGAEEYGGPRPFSEPETRIVRLIGQATRPQAFVNLHRSVYFIVPQSHRRACTSSLPAALAEPSSACCSCWCLNVALPAWAGWGIPCCMPWGPDHKRHACSACMRWSLTSCPCCSGEWAVYVPWDSQKALAPGLPEDIGDVLEKLDAYCQCMHGAAGEVAGCVRMHELRARRRTAHALSCACMGSSPVAHAQPTQLL